MQTNLQDMFSCAPFENGDGCAGGCSVRIGFIIGFVELIHLKSVLAALANGTEWRLGGRKLLSLLGVVDFGGRGFFLFDPLRPPPSLSSALPKKSGGWAVTHFTTSRPTTSEAPHCDSEVVCVCLGGGGHRDAWALSAHERRVGWHDLPRPTTTSGLYS